MCHRSDRNNRLFYKQWFISNDFLTKQSFFEKNQTTDYSFFKRLSHIELNRQLSLIIISNIKLVQMMKLLSNLKKKRTMKMFTCNPRNFLLNSLPQYCIFVNNLVKSKLHIYKIVCKLFVYFLSKDYVCIFSQNLSNENKQRLYRIQK